MDDIQAATLLDEALRIRVRKSSAPLGGWQPKSVACWDCGLTHALPGDVRQALASAEGFFLRHEGHAVNWFEQPQMAGLWRPNADVKEAFATEVAFTVTNLHSLASSVTAGWQSAVVDNTSNLYLDALVMAVISFPNSTPGLSKAIFIYAYGGIASGTYTYPCTGTQGTITLADVTTNAIGPKRIGRVAIAAQNVVIPDGPFSVAAAFAGSLPPYWGLCAINHANQTLVSSGNAMSYRPTFLTVI